VDGLHSEELVKAW